MITIIDEDMNGRGRWGPLEESEWEEASVEMTQNIVLMYEILKKSKLRSVCLYELL